MEPLIFSDGAFWEKFLPLTYTRPVADLRVGLLTFRERWRHLLGTPSDFFLTEAYLEKKYPAASKGPSLVLQPNFLPTPAALQAIRDLKEGEALVYHDELIASRINLNGFHLGKISKMTDLEEGQILFEHPWELFTYNKEALEFDFQLLTKDRKSQPIPESNFIRGPQELIFLEEGVDMEFAYLNTEKGPIYIGKNTEVQEGTKLRGPIGIGEGCTLKMGAKIYGPTTIGPYSSMGGEIKNVVVWGCSNKGHDGYLGNSVLGAWCNLGAGTSTSNMKNNLSSVKMWDFGKEQFEDTGLQFCGSVVGDHATTAINTQINTGTTIGVSANIFHEGLTSKLIPNFSWGGKAGDKRYRLDRVYETASRMMKLKNRELSDDERAILKYIEQHY